MSSDEPGQGPDRGRRLRCGRWEESLLEAAAEPGTLLDAHQRGCPYCRRALATLRQRWALVSAEAASPPPVPAGLVERMVGRLRTALREPSYLPVPSTRGRLRVARSVVEDIARQVVNDRGLPVVGCRAVQVEPALVIEIHVVLPYGGTAATQAEEARRAVIGAVAEWAGLDVTAVDVIVVDVTTPD